MALKDTDLKTVESYKKALKSEALKISHDDAKTKFWIYKEFELATESGKRQKLAPFVVVNDDKAVKPLLKGKTLLCRGFCGLQDGKVSFEPEQGKIPYKSLKMALPGLMGKQLAIPTGVNSDEDGDSAAIAETDAPAAAGTGAPATAQNGVAQQAVPEAAAAKESPAAPKTEAAAPRGPSPTGPSAGASSAADAVVAAWKKLEPEIQQKSAINATVKAGAEKAHQQIEDLLKGGKAEAAKQVLDNFTHALNAVAAPSSPGPAPSSPTSAAELTAAWGKLVPKIKAANNAALNQAANEAGKRLQELVAHSKFSEAQATIDQLARALDNLKPATETGTTAGHLTPADITGAWQELVPEIKKKAAAHPELNDAAMKARKQLEELTKAGKLDAAKAVIDELKAVVGKAGDEVESRASEEEEKDASSVTDKQQAEYERKFAQMDPDIQRALKEQRGDTSQIRAAVALAGERAEGGDYASALKVLSSLAALLAEADSPEGQVPTHELVEYRKKLLAFEAARQKAIAQVERLSAAIPQALPDEREVADELSEELQEQLEGIDDLIDAALSAAKNQQAPVTSSLKSQIQNTIKELNASPLIQHAEKNPFGVAIDVRNILGSSLEAILQAMPVEV